MRKMLVLFLGSWLIVAALAAVRERLEGATLPPETVPAEFQKIKAEFSQRIGDAKLLSLPAEYLAWVTMRVSLVIGEHPEHFSTSQFFLFVDRNEKVQLLFIGFYDAENRKIYFLGADIVSTGNEKRKGFFLTPIGLYRNSPENMSYRALGTKNEKGWRGLGAKDSRVWDFGWQETLKNKQSHSIRLLMHATDPSFGEKRLGKTDSKGCIRISGKLNLLLDHYGILDREYESHPKAHKFWVLKKNREPTTLAGKFLIVGDSSSSDSGK